MHVLDLVELHLNNTKLWIFDVSLDIETSVISEIIN